MFIRRAFEHRREQLHVKNVFGIRQILRDFLFNRAAFFRPKRFVRQQVLHPRCLNAQRHFQIFRRRREKILRERLLRVGVVVATKRGGNRGELIGGQTGAAAEHHVFRRVRRAGKTLGRFIGADAIIHHRRDDGRDRVADDDDLQSVRQRGAENIFAVGNFIRRRVAGKSQRERNDGSEYKCESFFEICRHKFDVQTNDKRRSFKREKKPPEKIERKDPAIQTGGMKMGWEKCCEIAAAEIEMTLAALPKPLRERAEKLPVTFEGVPNADLQADGIEPDTLGLFTGAEFTEEEHLPLPPQIILFLENLWNFAENDENVFRMEIRPTFLHELGHYFGLDEADLIARGLE